MPRDLRLTSVGEKQPIDMTEKELRDELLLFTRRAAEGVATAGEAEWAKECLRMLETFEFVKQEAKTCRT